MSKPMIFAGLSAYAVFALASAMVGAVDQAIDLGVLAEAFREPLAFVVERLSVFVSLFIDIDMAPLAVLIYLAMYVLSLFAITLLNLKPGVGFWAFVFAVVHLIFIFPLAIFAAASKPWFSKFEVPPGWFGRMLSGLVFSVLVVVLIISYASLGAYDLSERLANVDPCFNFGEPGAMGQCLPAFFGFGEGGSAPAMSEDQAIALGVTAGVAGAIALLVIFFLPAGLALGHKLRMKRMFGRVFLAALIAVGVSIASYVYEEVRMAEAGPFATPPAVSYG